MEEAPDYDEEISLTNARVEPAIADLSQRLPPVELTHHSENNPSTKAFTADTDDNIPTTISIQPDTVGDNSTTKSITAETEDDNPTTKSISTETVDGNSRTQTNQPRTSTPSLNQAENTKDVVNGEPVEAHETVSGHSKESDGEKSSPRSLKPNSENISQDYINTVNELKALVLRNEPENADETDLDKSSDMAATAHSNDGDRPKSPGDTEQESNSPEQTTIPRDLVEDCHNPVLHQPSETEGRESRHGELTSENNADENDFNIKNVKAEEDEANHTPPSLDSFGSDSGTNSLRVVDGPFERNHEAPSNGGSEVDRVNNDSDAVERCLSPTMQPKLPDETRSTVPENQKLKCTDSGEIPADQVTEETNSNPTADNTAQNQIPVGDHKPPLGKQDGNKGSQQMRGSQNLDHQEGNVTNTNETSVDQDHQTDKHEVEENQHINIVECSEATADDNKSEKQVAAEDHTTILESDSHAGDQIEDNSDDQSPSKEETAERNADNTSPLITNDDAVMHTNVSKTVSGQSSGNNESDNDEIKSLARTSPEPDNDVKDHTGSQFSLSSKADSANRKETASHDKISNHSVAIEVDDKTANETNSSDESPPQTNIASSDSVQSDSGCSGLGTPSDHGQSQNLDRPSSKEPAEPPQKVHEDNSTRQKTEDKDSERKTGHKNANTVTNKTSGKTGGSKPNESAPLPPKSSRSRKTRSSQPVQTSTNVAYSAYNRTQTVQEDGSSSSSESLSHKREPRKSKSSEERNNQHAGQESTDEKPVSTTDPEGTELGVKEKPAKKTKRKPITSSIKRELKTQLSNYLYDERRLLDFDTSDTQCTPTLSAKLSSPVKLQKRIRPDPRSCYKPVVKQSETRRLTKLANKTFESLDIGEIWKFHQFKVGKGTLNKSPRNGFVHNYSRHLGNILHSSEYQRFYDNMYSRKSGL